MDVTVELREKLAILRQQYIRAEELYGAGDAHRSRLLSDIGEDIERLEDELYSILEGQAP